MRRIVVVGSGGSGKSWLAVALGNRLDLPVVHLDKLYWRPGWIATPEEEWRAMQADLVQAETWIIDGNHAPSLDIRLPAADTVILLDLRRYRCLARAGWRFASYRWSSRTDLAEGCGERLSRQFLKWVWTFPKVGRPSLLDAIAAHASGANFIRLHTPRDVKAFLIEPSVQMKR